MEGRLLEADDVDGLRAAARGARGAGADAVVVSEGPVGDPFVLAAGLSADVGRVLLGVRTSLPVGGRHAAIVAREMTCLDLVCGGRTLLCFTPPFDERLVEALNLCRALWREGEVSKGGAHFPVDGAVNRPRPSRGDSPMLALDLTGGVEPPIEVLGLVDLVLRPADAPGACRVERTRPVRGSDASGSGEASLLED